jgi:hypothetical protein
MSATEFDSLVAAVDTVLSSLKKHKASTISTLDFKQALENALERWASVKSIVDPQEAELLDELLNSATVTAESSNPSVKLLKSRFEKIRKEVRRSKLSHVSRPLPQRYPELKAKSSSIQNQSYRTFLDEAFSCWTNRTLRAAIVTAWCALEAKIFDVYQSKWTIDQIKDLIPEAKRNFIKVHDDLTYLSDDALLKGLRDASVLGSAEYRLLSKVCKTYRDLAAHASLRREIVDDEVSASLGIMINFLTKSI